MTLENLCRLVTVGCWALVLGPRGVVSGAPQEQCEVRSCVVATPSGFAAADPPGSCLWCGSPAIDSGGGARNPKADGELFSLAGLADACAADRGGELAWPRKNWCRGVATVATAWDPDEASGCPQGLITDPCTGRAIQTPWTATADEGTNKEIAASTSSSVANAYAPPNKSAPWAGVGCSGGGRVTELSFTPASALACSLEDLPIWQGLGHLRSFAAPGNTLMGTLAGLAGHAGGGGGAASLQTLDLSDNFLTGPLALLVPPAGAAGGGEGGGGAAAGAAPPLGRLVSLRLAGNRLHGAVPPELAASLPRLQLLDLQRNALSGAVPASLAQHPHLKRIDVRDNAAMSENSGA